MTHREKQSILLNKFLHQLPVLKESRAIRQTDERKLKLEYLRKTLSVLLPVYRRQLDAAQKNIAAFCDENVRLLSPTTFEVMSRHKLEDTHSNVLAYLLSKENGYELLMNIILIIDQNNDFKSRKFNKDFKVVREKVIKGRRVDIWIEARNFLVIIENKFNAKLHMVDDGITQADFYRDELSAKEKKKNPIFILLDRKGTEFCDGYIPMNYEDLLKSLLSVEKSFKDDFVYTDYVFLLLRLASGIDGLPEGGMKQVNYLSSINNFNEVLSNGTKASYTGI